ncbi:MAG: hypothetical protein US81_C0037G0008 [Parcubacteria group bacterium GW2011_GWE2_38_18]|nr:MAG: hypothetical protein US81_C0037G0008 [Parcubacteria group bacterium GW2011_GWE2_38_18]
MKKNIYLYYKKIESYLFWPLTGVLIIVIFSNLFLIVAEAQLGKVNGNTQIGGRVATVIFCTAPPPICTGIPPVPTCTPGTFKTIITPFGNSGAQICAPAAMVTNGPPITVGSVGSYILGLFTVTDPMAISAQPFVGTTPPGI